MLEFERLFEDEDVGIIGMHYRCLQLCSETKIFIKQNDRNDEESLKEILNYIEEKNVDRLYFVERFLEYSKPIILNERMSENEIAEFKEILLKRIKEISFKNICCSRWFYW